MKLGKNEKHAYEFVKKYPGWHGFDNDRTTKNAIKSLLRKGLIKVNEFNQFSINEDK